MTSSMKVFVVDKDYNEAFWETCFQAIVIAEDAKHAERCARVNIDDFRKCKLTVKELDIQTEQVVMKQYKCW